MEDFQPRLRVNFPGSVMQIELDSLEWSQSGRFEVFADGQLLAATPEIPAFRGRAKPVSLPFDGKDRAKWKLVHTNLSGHQSEWNLADHDVEIIRSGVSSITNGGRTIIGWLYSHDLPPVGEYFLEITHVDNYQRRDVFYSVPIQSDRVAGLNLFSIEVSKAVESGHRIDISIPGQQLGQHVIDCIDSTFLSFDERFDALIREKTGDCDTAWLVGNGPSVRLDDLERIPSRDLKVAFNKFFLSYASHSFRPDLTFVVDKGMLEELAVISDRAESTVVFGDRAEPTTAFLAKRLGGLEMPVSQCRLNLFKGQAPFSEGGSVVYTAIQALVAAGFKRIYLYGIDMSFVIDRLEIKGDGLLTRSEGNHFIENYREGSAWFPPNWWNIMQGMVNTRVFCHFSDVSVLNLTRGGLLEVFERGLFEDFVD